MTRDDFITRLSSGMPYGTYIFNTDVFSGTIGRAPEQTVIALYPISPAEAAETEEPLYSGEYKTPDELLDQFDVGGQTFADTVLTEIRSLEKIAYA